MELSLFSRNDFLDLRYKAFLNSELGQFFQTIPFQELAVPFRPHMPRGKRGRRSLFTIEGGLGLMFLKHYLNMSDSKLIERLNSDWQMQMFCGIYIRFTKPIRDKDIVGRWRRFFAKHMDIDRLQESLAAHWKPYLSNINRLMCDATAYESDMRYPTDVKLLWESTEWVFQQVERICLLTNQAVPKTNYKEQEARQNAYDKRRRKTRAQTRHRKRWLLFWLARGLDILNQTLDNYTSSISLLGEHFVHRLGAVKEVLFQQRYMFDMNVTSVPGRIVSLAKPYIRPIIRGKENKRVEFGAKLNISQVDGINFIEHFSFEAFNECTRVQSAICKHEKMFGKCEQFGADQIYATNKNRTYLSKKGITTNFRRKGRKPKNDEQDQKIRKELGKARATVLEGSFGTEKNHYMLKRVAARTEQTEKAWIFFGIHTANAVRMITKIKEAKKSACSDLKKAA